MSGFQFAQLSIARQSADRVPRDGRIRGQSGSREFVGGALAGLRLATQGRRRQRGRDATVGSVLVGSQVLIEKARRWRKVAGGGWRQAGGLAAAGLHALDHHVARLADDHARAARLAASLRELRGLEVIGQHTNMIFIDVPIERLAAFKAHIESAGIRMSIGYLPSIRLVTHLDIDDDAIERTLVALRAFFH